MPFCIPYRKMRVVHPRDVLGDEDVQGCTIRVPSASNVEVDCFCKVARRREASSGRPMVLNTPRGCDKRGTHYIHTIFFGLGG